MNARTAGNRVRAGVWALAALSAMAASVVSRVLFPVLSSDNDEAIYRLQAQTIAQGHLFPPAPYPPGSFTPWLAALVDHHYVLKYTPLLPGVFAASLKMTTSFVPVLALFAAGAVVVTYCLALELTEDRTVSALAAVVMALSPMVVIQSGLLLPYLPTTVLLEVFVWLMVRGVRTRTVATLIASGLALGLAISTRPYDAVLLAAPLLVWAAIEARRRRRLMVVGWWLLGLLGPIIGLIAFNVAATGHPFKLVFGVLEPSDSLGFGVHRLYPGDVAHHFDLEEGFYAVRAHLALLGKWAFAGVVLGPIAIFTVARRRVGAPEKALVWGVVLVIVGYLGFWGASNAVSGWGGAHYLGPFYALPALIVIAIVGSKGTVHLWASTSGRARSLLAGALVIGAFLSATVLVDAVNANRRFTDQDKKLAALVGGVANGSPALVFVDVDPAFLMHPSPVIANTPSLDNQPLFAIASGTDDFNVLKSHSSSAAYVLNLAFNAKRTPGARWSARLQEVSVYTGDPLIMDARIQSPHPTEPMDFAVSWSGLERLYRVEAGTDHFLVTATASGIAVDGRQPEMVTEVPADDGWMSMSLRSTGDKPKQIAAVRMPAVVMGAGLEAIVPTRDVGTLGKASSSTELEIAPLGVQSAG